MSEGKLRKSLKLQSLVKWCFCTIDFWPHLLYSGCKLRRCKMHWQKCLKSSSPRGRTTRSCFSGFDNGHSQPPIKGVAACIVSWHHSKRSWKVDHETNHAVYFGVSFIFLRFLPNFWFSQIVTSFKHAGDTLAVRWWREEVACAKLWGPDGENKNRYTKTPHLHSLPRHPTSWSRSQHSNVCFDVTYGNILVQHNPSLSLRLELSWCL